MSLPDRGGGDQTAGLSEGCRFEGYGIHPVLEEQIFASALAVEGMQTIEMPTLRG
jgi:hypothetical protein